MLSESYRTFTILSLTEQNPWRRIMLLDILGYRSALLFKNHFELG